MRLLAQFASSTFVWETSWLRPSASTSSTRCVWTGGWQRFGHKTPVCPLCKREVSKEDVLDEREADLREIVRRSQVRVQPFPVPQSQVPPNQPPTILKNFGQLSTKTRKQDVVNLLRIEGQFYLPPDRNLNSEFVRSFLAGRKALFRVSEVIRVKHSFRFKELSLAALLSRYPRPTQAQSYLPDEKDLSKLDREYSLNVSSKDLEHCGAELR